MTTPTGINIYCYKETLTIYIPLLKRREQIVSFRTNLFIAYTKLLSEKMCVCVCVCICMSIKYAIENNLMSNVI